MIRLALEEINIHAPYEVVPTDDGLDFHTDFGVHYRISFTEEAPIGNCDTYQFMLRKVQNVHSKHDPKVEQTVLAIIDEFFRSNLNVLMYICDTSDGREAKRSRLFLMWFKKYAGDRFVIHSAQAQIEDEILFISFIIEQRNPYMAAVEAQLAAEAEMMKDHKPDIYTT